MAGWMGGKRAGLIMVTGIEGFCFWGQVTLWFIGTGELFENFLVGQL